MSTRSPNDTIPVVLHGRIVDENGVVSWYRNGQLHRKDGPARITADGNQLWFYKDQKHRIGGPAVIYSNGVEAWYQYGRLHRFGAPAVVNTVTGDEAWYQQGQLHRIDGPATIKSGEGRWFLRGTEYKTDLGFQFRSGLSDEEMAIMILKYGHVTA